MWAILGLAIWTMLVLGIGISISTYLTAKYGATVEIELKCKQIGRVAADLTLWGSIAIWPLSYWYFGKYAGIPTARIIFCEARVLLVRTPYRSDWDVQVAFPDYKGSHGPWSEPEIAHFLSQMIGQNDERWPFSRAAISAFFRSKEKVLEYQGHPFRPKDLG
jgi:hypothetical protein